MYYINKERVSTHTSTLSVAVRRNDMEGPKLDKIMGLHYFAINLCNCLIVN